MTNTEGPTPSFSIADVLRGIARRKLLVLSCAALGVLAGAGVLAVFKPAYQAEARVLVDDLETPYDQANMAQANRRDPVIDDRVIKSQVAVLESADLSMRVIDALHLSGKGEFEPLANGMNIFSTLAYGLGFGDDPRLMTADERALVRMQSKLTVYQLPESNVVAVKYVARDGETAANVANALAETYVLSTRESKSGTNSRAREWLAGQIAALRSKVTESDAAVERFRSEKGLFRTRETTLGAQEISELNTQITLAEAARSEAQARADEIRDLLASKGSVDASSDVLNSPTIQSLRGLQVSATRKVSELSATYLPNHPKMLAAQKEVNDVDRQIRREALKIVEGLQGQAKVAAARANSLRDSLDNMKGRESVSAQDEVKLKELEREAKANRDQLEAMLARYADSNTRQNLDLQPGFARIIQQASAPANPYFPKAGPTLLLTTVIGLGLGLGLAFLFEIMSQAARMSVAAGGQLPERQGARGSHAVRQSGQFTGEIPDIVPVLVPMAAPVAPPVATVHAPSPPQPPVPKSVATVATIPLARTFTEARSVLAEFSAQGSAAGQLSKGLLSLHQQGKLSPLAFSGIGTSTEMPAAALAVARQLANEGLKTILIDLDDRQGVIADLLELPFASGMAELVAGQADFANVIQRDALSPLQFIRAGNTDLHKAVLAQRMESVTRTLAGIYDCVLLHAGQASPHSLPLLKGCTATVLCAEATRMKDVTPAIQTLHNQGVGSVLVVKVEGLLRKAA